MLYARADPMTSDPSRSVLAARPDRKSTRLNSSHLVISYAVFCLKKKKNSREREPGAQPSRHKQAESLGRHCRAMVLYVLDGDSTTPHGIRTVTAFPRSSAIA